MLADSPQKESLAAVGIVKKGQFEFGSVPWFGSYPIFTEMHHVADIARRFKSLNGKEPLITSAVGMDLLKGCTVAVFSRVILSSAHSKTVH